MTETRTKSSGMKPRQIPRAPRHPTPGKERIAVVSSVIPPAYSGAGFAASKYAGRLSRAGKLAFLLTHTSARDADATGTLWKTPGDAAGRDSFLILRTSNKKSRSPTWAPTCAFWTTWHLIRNRNAFNIVHCFSPTWLSLWAVLIGKLLGKTLVMETTLIGGDDPYYSIKGKRWSAMGIRRRIQYRLSDKIVCLSPPLMDACQAAGIPNEKLFLIPRAVDVDTFHPANEEEKRHLRKLLGIEGSPILLFVGNLIQRKGIDLILAAAPPLVRKYPDMNLVLVGSMDKTTETRSWTGRFSELMKAQGLNRNINLLGTRNDIPDLMRAADVFILPSRREGFPNVVAEAMSSGCPVVLNDMEGIARSIVTDDVDGFIMKEDSVDSLVETIDRALNAPSSIQVKARTTARNRFSSSSVDSRYYTMYASDSETPRNSQTINHGISSS